MSRVIFAGKGPNETLNQVFNFASRLAASETISTKVVTATVYSGTDASPGALISGAATSSGAAVTQAITGGQLGVVYLLTCAITTSAAQTLRLSGYLVITPE